jgi:hypothetical protein
MNVFRCAPRKATSGRLANPNEPTSAWQLRGITYRRKRNVHGFDGVRLKDGDDE